MIQTLKRLRNKIGMFRAQTPTVIVRGMVSGFVGND